MSNQTENFGLDAELQKKRTDKFSPELENEAVNWLETLSGKEKGDFSTHEWLKDGQVLCAAMNRVQPDSISKINTSKMAFKQMENISKFITAIQAYGVPAFDSFQTVDLFEDKNMGQVINCIHSLGREAQRKKFNGPVIGVKPSDENRRDFDETILRAGDGMVSQHTTGYSGGASQSGTLAGGTRREVTTMGQETHRYNGA
eukprot:CFRG2276T1